MNPSDYRDRQKNFINAASLRLQQKFKAQRQTDTFMLRLGDIINDVMALARPIQQAGGAVKPDDLQNLKEHVLQWTMERLASTDRETVRLIAGTYLAQAILKDIEANPWGGSEPDALSPS